MWETSTFFLLSTTCCWFVPWRTYAWFASPYASRLLVGRVGEVCTTFEWMYGYEWDTEGVVEECDFETKVRVLAAYVSDSCAFVRSVDCVLTAWYLTRTCRLPSESGRSASPYLDGDFEGEDIPLSMSKAKAPSKSKQKGVSCRTDMCCLGTNDTWDSDDAPFSTKRKQVNIRNLGSAGKPVYFCIQQTGSPSPPKKSKKAKTGGPFPCRSFSASCLLVFNILRPQCLL